MTKDRTYEETHAWLNFSIDLRRAPEKLWVMLGECQSKCQHIAGVPLRPDTASLLFQTYLAKGVLATTAIEGNTLSEEEVLQHLQGKLRLPPSREYLAQEIDNILLGCNRILREVQSEREITLSVGRIRTLNRTVLEGLKLEQDVVSGEIRRHEVGVARYKGAPAKDCEYLLNRLCDWLNSEDFLAPSGMVFVFAIIKAVIAHLYLAWIHPFGDGNGRTARLVEFQILIGSGVPAPAAHLLSNHYNQTRTEYYRQLDESSRSGGNLLPFLIYAVEGFLDGLRSQLKVIRFQQWDGAWENYVYEAFRDRHSRSELRRRQLLLDLSKKNEFVSRLKLPTISPKVAASYAGKTRRTLSRDLNALLAMGLVQKQGTSFRARMELILAFLPPTAQGR